MEPTGTEAIDGSPRGQRAIRRRLVEVASALFVEQGYRATTTKQICELAETTERTMFRNFGSKAGLFEATVAEPFSEFVAQWAASFANHPVDRPLDEVLEGWIAALVDFIEQNRVQLRMLIVADFEADDSLRSVADHISAQFARGIQQLVDEAGAELIADRGLNVDDPMLTLAAGFSMALGMLLLDKWLFTAAHGRPRRDQIVKEIKEMMLCGITVRPKL